jgi:hypothetical protein
VSKLQAAMARAQLHQQAACGWVGRTEGSSHAAGGAGEHANLPGLPDYGSGCIAASVYKVHALLIIVHP